MNGRVYDPGLGRFLSVDPVFQFPEDTQSLNPYSYVRNSPLTRTDPTGFEEPPKDAVTGAAANQNDTNGKGESEETGDARSKHFARANKKFDQPGATGSGTPTMRNLANGIDTRVDAARFDRLGKQLADTIGQVSKRAEDLANRCATVSCRSDFYGTWDKQLRKQFGEKAPVFFGGAAGVTGRWQVGAADTNVPDFFSAETERFLVAANTHLFRLNTEVYLRLATQQNLGPLQGLRGADLDKALVAFEQSSLEKFATGYFGNNFAAQGRVYNNISTLINATATSSTLGNHTQRAVAANWPDGNFDFGDLQHRITLGQSIMQYQRNGE